MTPKLTLTDALRLSKAQLCQLLKVEGSGFRRVELATIAVKRQSTLPRFAELVAESKRRHRERVREIREKEKT